MPQAIFGNWWHWVNPWTGVYKLFPSIKVQIFISLKLPDRAGVWPAVIIYIFFSLFALADPAPEDPLRLAFAAFVSTVIGFLALRTTGVGYMIVTLMFAQARYLTI